MDHQVLHPESAFSRAVFQHIRPHIPKERWPLDMVRAMFTLSDDGLYLDADFEGFPTNYAAIAREYVKAARVELVIKSPLALVAREFVRIKRWRDTFLFASVPLLFGIPIMGIIGEAPMRFAASFFCLNLMGLIWWQGRLVGQRKQVKQAGFIAQIPAPGFRLGGGHSDDHPGTLSDSPDL